jgi:rubredoxin
MTAVICSGRELKVEGRMARLEPIEARDPMEKHECAVCGYVYDPEIGDDSQNIPPGTPFANLPDDWVCPNCGATKEMFEATA